MRGILLILIVASHFVEGYCGAYCDELGRKIDFDLLKFLEKVSGRLTIQASLDITKLCGKVSFNPITQVARQTKKDGSFWEGHLGFDRPGVWNKTIPSATGPSHFESHKVMDYGIINNEAYMLVYACDCDGKYPILFNILTTDCSLFKEAYDIFLKVKPILSDGRELHFCQEME